MESIVPSLTSGSSIGKVPRGFREGPGISGSGWRIVAAHRWPAIEGFRGESWTARVWGAECRGGSVSSRGMLHQSSGIVESRGELLTRHR